MKLVKNVIKFSEIFFIEETTSIIIVLMNETKTASLWIVLLFWLTLLSDDLVNIFAHDKTLKQIVKTNLLISARF